MYIYICEPHNSDISLHKYIPPQYRCVSVQRTPMSFWCFCSCIATIYQTLSFFLKALLLAVYRCRPPRYSSEPHNILIYLRPRYGWVPVQSTPCLFMFLVTWNFSDTIFLFCLKALLLALYRYTPPIYPLNVYIHVLLYFIYWFLFFLKALSLFYCTGADHPDILWVVTVVVADLSLVALQNVGLLPGTHDVI